MAGLRRRQPTGAGALVFDGRTRLRSVVLSAGSDAASASLFPTSDGSGTAELVVKAPANDTKQVLVFSDWDNVFCTVTGTGSAAYLETD